MVGLAVKKIYVTTHAHSHFPKQALVFTCLKYKSFVENTVGKGEIAGNEQFLLFPLSVFYPFEKLSAIFVKFEIVVCKLFQYGSV